MIIFVFIKDPVIYPEIAEQHLSEIRLTAERHRKTLEDREKEIVTRWHVTQGNSNDDAITS